MSSINDIPVHTEFEPATVTTAMVAAIVNEVIQLMDAYLSHGEPGSVDIKSMPLSADDYEQLQQALGRGEISISAQLSGDSNIYETAHAGVWWITHRNMDNKVIAEHIEVGAVPSILGAHREDIKQARIRLLEARDTSE